MIVITIKDIAKIALILCLIITNVVVKIKSRKVLDDFVEEMKNDKKDGGST